MKKTLISGALALISINSFADTSIPDVKGQMQVTANVAAGCDLSAENINFGMLQMPLSQQSASGNLNIKCSKGANLSIALLHDGVNGGGGVITSVRKTTGLSYTQNILYRDGERISNYLYDTVCDNGSPYIGKLLIYTQEAAEVYGLTWNPDKSNRMMLPDTWGACKSHIYDSAHLTNLSRVGGILSGVVAGEQIKYTITKPSETTLWGSGTSAYQFVATGDEQLIPMKANINTADNPTHRMTPDTYTSTVTVQLSY